MQVLAEGDEQRRCAEDRRPHVHSFHRGGGKAPPGCIASGGGFRLAHPVEGGGTTEERSPHRDQEAQPIASAPSSKSAKLGDDEKLLDERGEMLIKPQPSSSPSLVNWADDHGQSLEKASPVPGLDRSASLRSCPELLRRPAPSRSPTRTTPLEGGISPSLGLTRRRFASARRSRRSRDYDDDTFSSKAPRFSRHGLFSSQGAVQAGQATARLNATPPVRRIIS